MFTNICYFFHNKCIYKRFLFLPNVYYIYTENSILVYSTVILLGAVN